MLPLLGCNVVNIILQSAVKVGGCGNDKVSCEGDGDTFDKFVVKTKSNNIFSEEERVKWKKFVCSYGKWKEHLQLFSYY